MKAPRPTTGDNTSWPEAEVERAATTDRSRPEPELSQPYLEWVDDTAYLCATDGYILAMVPVEADEEEPAGYVPAEALRTARKWKGSLKFNRSEVAVQHPKDNRRLILERPDLGTFPSVWKVVKGTLSERDSRPIICLDVELLYRAARAIGARVVRLSLPAGFRPILVEPAKNPDGRLALVMPFALGAEDLT